MPSLRSQVYDKVHAALLAALSADGATAARIIPANDNGDRPTAAYLTILVQSNNDVSSTVARRVAGSTTVSVSGRQIREAQVSIQAFGDLAVEWLDLLPLRLEWPTVATHAEIRVTSPLADLTQFLDTRFEARAEMGLGVYVQVTDPRPYTVPTALIADVDFIADDFSEEFTIEVNPS